MKLIIIVLIQLLYVPMLTLRTISMVKNLKVLTAFFGFMESLIYIFGISIVLTGEQTVLEMMVYAAGFAMGLFVGILVEQKLAIGYTSLHINIAKANSALVNKLREQGFGVTVFKGEGHKGTRERIDVLTQRRKESILIETIQSFEPDAFIISYDPVRFRGGYLTKIMKERYKANSNDVEIKTA